MMSHKISRALASIIATSAVLSSTSSWSSSYYDEPIEQKGPTGSICKKSRNVQNIGHREKIKAKRRKANKNARKARKRNR